MKSRGMNWKRLLAAFVVAELVPIAVLVAIIAIARPAHEDPTAFANRVGSWVGPIGGALMAFVMARWLVRPLTAGRVRHGLALGILLAVLDAVLLVAGGQAFRWLFVLSNTGKIVAALCGAIAAPQTWLDR